MVLEYAKAAADETAARKRKDKLKLELAKLAAGHQVVVVAGQKAYSYTPGRRTNTNYERLREKYPHVYDDPEIVYETPYHSINISSEIRKMAKES